MHRVLISVSATCLVATVAACSGGDSQAVDLEHEVAALEVGGRAADALLGTLVSNLTAAMQEGGPAAAVEFCSIRAMELTADVAAAEVLEMKRTSLRYRNPANAPDEHETKALRHFETALAETGALPSAWVQRVGLDEYRYYRPLTVAPPCLKCHGSAGEIDPDVTEILADRYPDDLATGYAAGDFRGVVRVSIPEDRLRPAGD